jgi:hypothetical protein
MPIVKDSFPEPTVFPQLLLFKVHGISSEDGLMEWARDA